MRSKRLEELDEAKLAFAVFLIAKGIVEERTSREVITPVTDGGDTPTGSEAAA